VIAPPLVVTVALPILIKPLSSNLELEIIVFALFIYMAPPLASLKDFSITMVLLKNVELSTVHFTPLIKIAPPPV